MLAIAVALAATFLVVAPTFGEPTKQPSVEKAATDPPAADSDTEADPADVLAETVLVTARLIEEDAQKVPISVTLLDGDQLKQQGISNISDLTYAVPSLTIHPYFNTLTNSYSIRGLSAGQSTYFSESPCCFANASLPLTDIESVQVINGPQGTLFGRSSASGAILITPVHPNLSQTEGYAEIGFGDYGRQQLAAAINVPVIRDRLAVRFATRVEKLAGYTRALGSDLRFDEQQNSTSRMSAQFELGSFSNYTAATYIDLDQSATNQILSGIYLNAAGGLYNLPESAAGAVFGPICASAVAQGFEPSIEACVASRYQALRGIREALAAEYSRVTGSKGAVRFEPSPVNQNPANLRLQNFSVVNVAQYKLVAEGPWKLRLKDIFSFESAADVASSPADGIGGLAEQGGASSVSGYGSSNQLGRYVVARIGPRTQTVNNEFQFHFDGHQGLIVGTLGFFSSHYRQPATNLGTGNIYQIFGGVFNENLGYNSALGFPAGGSGGETAAFGQVTVDLDKWVRGLKLTGGYRFSWTDTTNKSRPAVLDSATGVFHPGQATILARTESSGPNYNFGLTEQATDNLMVYFTLSRAYVPGGLNQFDSGQAGGDPATALPNFASSYGPEKVQARELGLKWDFRSNGAAGRINAAVYHYTFSDIQQNFSGVFNNLGYFYTANVAEATHQGFEVSTTWIPSPAFELRLSYNYNDFHYDKWIGQDPAGVAQPGDALCHSSSPSGFCLLDLTKNPAVGMPPHQGHLTTSYQVPAPILGGRLEVSATIYSQARVYFQATAHRELQVLGPDSIDAYSQEPYTTVHLRSTWSSENGRWGFSLIVRNALDQVYKLGTTAQVLSLGFGTASYAQPRMIGFELSRKF